MKMDDGWKCNAQICFIQSAVVIRKTDNPNRDIKRIVWQSRIKTKKTQAELYKGVNKNSRSKPRITLQTKPNRQAKVVFRKRVSQVFQTNIWSYCYRLRKSDQCSDKEPTKT